MRSIKFRLRIKEKNGKISITYCSLDDFCNDYGLSEKLSVSNILSKDEYTGIKDISGKEIYEGDIVRTSFPGGSVYESEVVWDRFAWFTTDNYRKDFIDATGESHEVIGNIYKN